MASLDVPHRCGGQHDLNQLVNALTLRTEPDMNRFACSEALDCMEAYYKVALKRFIDDVAIEVVEAKLVSPLGGIFTPVAVSAMSVDLVASIAGESEENRAQREQLNQQLEVFTQGYDTCKRFIGVRLFGADDGTTQNDSEFDNDFANDESSDFDNEEPGCEYPPALHSEPEISGWGTEPAVEVIPDTPIDEFDPWGKPTSKKGKKKGSRISDARATFEQM